jgi:hypothetical protein
MLAGEDLFVKIEKNTIMTAPIFRSSFALPNMLLMSTPRLLLIGMLPKANTRFHIISSSRLSYFYHSVYYLFTMRSLFSILRQDTSHSRSSSSGSNWNHRRTRGRNQRTGDDRPHNNSSDHTPDPRDPAPPRQPSNDKKDGVPPASLDAMNKLVPLRLRGIDEDNQECLICAEAYEIGCVVTPLPCGHLYHSTCVTDWLCRQCTCPVCRYEIPTDNADYEAGRQERMEQYNSKNHTDLLIAANRLEATMRLRLMN